MATTNPVGIDPTLTFGLPTTQVVTHPFGIASTLAFGRARVAPATNFSGVATATVDAAKVKTIVAVTASATSATLP